MVKAKTYVAAAILTIILVGFAFGINWWWNQQREEALIRDITELQTIMSDTQLELLYVTQFGEGCDTIAESRSSTAAVLEQVNRRLIESEKNIIVPDWEWNRLKSEQTMLYVKLWMLTLQMRDDCGSNITTVLYFYDTVSPESQQQGYVLDSITNQYGTKSVQIVPLEKNSKLGIMRILTKQFNVTTTPTIIIDEKTKIEGVISKADLVSKLGI